MPDLRVVFTKAKDAQSKDVLTCIRRDGSRTWTKLHAALPIHDITHFAVETTLNARNGFFGLLAQGWDITDFGIPEKRSAMPLEALWIEHVVGIIWREFLTRDVAPYNEFAAAISESVTSLRENLARDAKRLRPHAEYSDEEIELLSRGISEAERAAIMNRISELAGEWARVGRGEVMEIAFYVRDERAPGVPSLFERDIVHLQ
jgi:hypothetical protein